jgi:hypothetical protein
MGAIKLIKRAVAVAALSILGACGQSGSSGGPAPDKFAGLDTEILTWRSQIVAADPLCKSTAADQKCQSFEVACKAERTVTPADAAKGITARVVTAMTWNGFDPQLKQQQAGSRTSEFTKGPSGWTRADHPPVNTSTCADL